MAAVDPFVSLRDWRSSLYRGKPTVVDRFLDGIDAALAHGWVRDREYERTRCGPTGSAATCSTCREMRRCGYGSSG